MPEFDWEHIRAERRKREERLAEAEALLLRVLDDTAEVYDIGPVLADRIVAFLKKSGRGNCAVCGHPRNAHPYRHPFKEEGK